MKLKFRLNGKQVTIEASGGERLIDLLREKFELVGTKEGCGKGECGACTVLLDSEPVCSCLILSSQISDREITTIEGIESNDHFKPLQEAFQKTGAVQCGFCSPGMILSASALLSKNPKPTRLEIKRSLSGNLCRCTGYSKIIEAVELASENNLISKNKK